MTDQFQLSLMEIGPHEHPLLLEFYKLGHPNGVRIGTLYDWRVGDIEASGGIITIAARHGSQIVGAISLIPLELGLGGSRTPGAWHADTLVAASHRGRGIARKLVDVSAAGLPLVAAKGTQPVMYTLRKSMGFQDAPNSTYLLRALSPISLSGSFRKRLAVLILYLISLFRRETCAPPTLQTRIVTRFDPDFDLLCGRILLGREATPVKSSRYLNWRYTECPGRRYLIVRAEDQEGQLRGGAVVRPNARPYRDAWLVDMVVDVDDQEAQLALLHTCIAELRHRKASCIKTFSTSPTIRRCLMRQGFRDTGISPRFTYRVAPDAVHLARAPWNIWHGDGDTELADPQ